MGKKKEIQEYLSSTLTVRNKVDIELLFFEQCVALFQVLCLPYGEHCKLLVTHTLSLPMLTDVVKTIVLSPLTPLSCRQGVDDVLLARLAATAAAIAAYLSGEFITEQLFFSQLCQPLSPSS